MSVLLLCWVFFFFTPPLLLPSCKPLLPRQAHAAHLCEELSPVKPLTDSQCQISCSCWKTQKTPSFPVAGCDSLWSENSLSWVFVPGSCLLPAPADLMSKCFCGFWSSHCVDTLITLCAHCGHWAAGLKTTPGHSASSFWYYCSSVHLCVLS